jgi:hypothetical protein
MWRDKSRIRETPTLSTDAASRTNTNLKRKRLSFFFLSLPAAVGAAFGKGLLGKKNNNKKTSYLYPLK